MLYPTIAQINVGAFKHNLSQVCRRVGGKAKIMAILKADAYGHGLKELSRAASQAGVYAIGVSDVEEGLSLRNYGCRLPVLVLGGFLEDQADEAVRNNLSLTVSSEKQFSFLAGLSQKTRQEVKVHLKIDTGMGRLGFKEDEFTLNVNRFFDQSLVRIEGIFSHLSSAFDPKEKEFTLSQISGFKNIVAKINIARGESSPLSHLANSAGILDYPQSCLDLVRPGIILYGYMPDSAMENTIDLKPVMSIKTKIIHLQKIKKGEGVSYGRNHRVARDSRMAVLPIGYSLGYSRLLSHKAEVLIKGKRVRQTGIVCMDMCMVDVTGLEDIEVGEEVVIMGEQGGEKITALDLAEKIGTIPYEVLCNLGSKIHRQYV